MAEIEKTGSGESIAVATENSIRSKSGRFRAFSICCEGIVTRALVRRADADYLLLQRTFRAWRRSTGAQVVEIDSELFQIFRGCFGVATPGCGDACLMVLDDFHRVLQAVAACRVRQGERLDQCVRGSVDLVQRDLRIFFPAAGSPAATETSDSLA